MRFVPETLLSENEIRAGMDGGVLEPWRIDGNGVQWFRSVPPMHGVPDNIRGDDEDFEADDDGDEECEFYGDDFDEDDDV